jgi:hypothetical protein
MMTAALKSASTLYESSHLLIEKGFRAELDVFYSIEGEFQELDIENSLFQAPNALINFMLLINMGCSQLSPPLLLQSYLTLMSQMALQFYLFYSHFEYR